MSYSETKVYFDGSHYIAIPHTTRPSKPRREVKEELITVIQENKDEGSTTEEVEEPFVSLGSERNDIDEEVAIDKNTPKIVNERKLTKKELFNELYQKYINLSKKERKNRILEGLKPYFDNFEILKLFVDVNIERKRRNLICRRVRMCRKANLAGFNYFCTFTYDNQKHTETSFKKGIKACLRNMCYRKNWKYMGVWERAPKTSRLHFHGLFNIPEGTMPGELNKIRDYDTISFKIQESIQSSYFNERFGRSDFKEIDENEKRLGNALAYLMKYIEKTGEKIVYSKGLPQYFISDIIETDVVTTIGQEDKKLLLFDDFKCIDEGELIGTVSPQTILKMRKSN